jgi:hypothetical protein
MCLAVDADGNALSTAAPTSSKRWRATRIDAHPGLFGLTAVACPATTLCVATDGNGGVLASRNPAAPKPRWTRSAVTGTTALFGISCASTSLCVALDRDTVFVSSHPASGGWRPTRISLNSDEQLSSIDCTAPSRCVIGDEWGFVGVSENPSGGASAWPGVQVDPGAPTAGPFDGLQGISCPSTSLCVAVDASGNTISSTAPAGGAGAWSLNAIDGFNALEAISCPSRFMCAAVDPAGKVVTSTDPLNPGAPWRAVVADPGRQLSAISCFGPTLCVAIDRSGNAVASADPAAPAPTWTVTNLEAATSVNRGPLQLSGLTGVACPTPVLCVIVDSSGNAFVSSAPAAGAWSSAHIDNNIASGMAGGLTAVSCADMELCVAVDLGGVALLSTDPAGGPQAWVPSAIDGTTAMSAVSCPSPVLCVAVDTGGDVLASADPSGGLTTWAWQHVLTAQQEFTGVSCADASLCFAFPSQGASAIESFAPAGPNPGWTAIPLLNPTAVACPTATGCIAVDGSGNAYLGRVRR